MTLAPSPPLHEQVILVTGAARRVGSAIARHLHGQGARVVLHCRTARAEADALATALNGARPASAMVVQADLLDTAQLPALIAAVLTRYGRLDGLVNNASSFFPTAIGEINENAWESLVGSNFKAPLFLAQAAAPALRASGGAIVNITDVHAERPLQGYPLYSAAKGALLTLTRALAVELAPEVRVNAVAPGRSCGRTTASSTTARAPGSCAIRCSSGKVRRRTSPAPWPSCCRPPMSPVRSSTSMADAPPTYRSTTWNSRTTSRNSSSA